LFNSIGLLGLPQSTPAHQASNFTSSLSRAPVNAYSRFEVHHIGHGLWRINVSQGGAAGDQFRYGSLVGTGQRIFLLHDGRTTNLVTAIDAHEGNGSEANAVEGNFDNLTHAAAANMDSPLPCARCDLFMPRAGENPKVSLPALSQLANIQG